MVSINPLKTGGGYDLTPEKIQSRLNGLKLISCFFTCEVYVALEKIGFFDVIKNKKLTIGELAQQLKVEEKYLRVCVDFIFSLGDVFEKKNEHYTLKTKEIEELIWLISAYKPVFDSLAAILRGEKIYGKDVVRDGFYLQKSSYNFSRDATEKIISRLKNENDAVLIDLGCGSAKTLIDFCKDGEGRHGIGIEISDDILKEANKNVMEARLQNKITFLKSDVIEVVKWQEIIPRDKKIIFLASAIMHEFLRDGELFLTDFIKKIGNIFSGSKIFIVEFDAIPFENINIIKDKEKKSDLELSKEIFAAVYQLWHPLTNQGMPQPRHVWEQILKNAGLNISHVTRADKNLLIYECIYNRPTA